MFLRLHYHEISGAVSTREDEMNIWTWESTVELARRQENFSP